MVHVPQENLGIHVRIYMLRTLKHTLIVLKCLKSLKQDSMNTNSYLKHNFD